MILNPYRLLPRRWKLYSLTILILGLVQTLIYLFFFTSNDHGEQFNNNTINKLLLESGNNDDYILNYKSELNLIKNNNNFNKNWKIFTDLHYYKDSINYREYLQTREKNHYYDPRITLSVYLNEITSLYANENRNANENKEINISFSWQDWIDLSSLNIYLQYNEDEKPNCQDILENGINYEITNRIISDSDLNINNSLCIDNKNFLKKFPKKADANLLPGFNFIDRSEIKTFPEKIIHAKSYLLSFAPLPNSIIFLTKNGSYEVIPNDDSTMINNGMFNNFVNEKKKDNEESNEKIIFNPISEFNKLKKARSPREPKLKFDDLLNESNSFSYDIPKELFKNEPESLIKELQSKPSLSKNEASFLESLEYSMSLDDATLGKSMREVNIIWTDRKYNGHTLKEDGGGYDYRFFNGFLTESQINKFDNIDYKRKIILNHLIHTWLQFTYREGIVSFIAHGTLLSWFWDGLIFEWDKDIDVQMPINELNNFCMNYNGSLILQDIEFGYGKYYIHCTNSITHRNKGNGNNNIDARFVDVDSGMFIDITGLSITDDIKRPNTLRGVLPQEIENKYPRPNRKNKKIDLDKNPGVDYDELFKIHEEFGIYNCRNDHFYSYQQLSPLKLSSMENSPALIPNDFRSVLVEEYTDKSLRSFSHNKFIYVKELRLWIPTPLMKTACRKAGATSRLRSPEILSYYYKNSEKVVNQLLKGDELIEFFITWEQTKKHELEMEYRDNLMDFGNSLNQLLSSYKKYLKPIRKVLFDYLKEIEILDNRGLLKFNENESLRSTEGHDQDQL